MNGAPTEGIRGSKPHFRPAKEELPELNRDYIETRTRTQKAKAEEAEIDLEIKKGTLISRKLAGLSAAFLLTSFRQRVLAAPQGIARRLLSAQLIDQKYEHQAAALIRQELIEMLDQLANLPTHVMNVANSNWIAEIDGDLSEQVQPISPEHIKQRQEKQRVRNQKQKEALRRYRAKGRVK